MSPHHATNPLDDSELIEMFRRQKRTGVPEGSFSKGKLTASDEGDLAFAVAADQRNRRIIIDFGKSVAWIGLDIETTQALIDLLEGKLQQLRGITH